MSRLYLEALPIKYDNGIVDHLNDLKCDPDSEWSTP